MVTDKSMEYWYFKGLECAYTCFRCLKLRKVIQTETKYFYKFLSCTVECLSTIQQKVILMVRLTSLRVILFDFVIVTITCTQSLRLYTGKLLMLLSI